MSNSVVLPGVVRRYSFRIFISFRMLIFVLSPVVDIVVRCVSVMVWWLGWQCSRNWWLSGSSRSMSFVAAVASVVVVVVVNVSGRVQVGSTCTNLLRAASHFSRVFKSIAIHSCTMQCWCESALNVVQCHIDIIERARLIK